MPFSRKAKIIISLVVIVTFASIGTFLIVSPLLNQGSSAGEPDVRVELLAYAGVKIESAGLRIYVDPYDLPASYSAYPADVILITHPHFDHYEPASIELLETEDTVIVLPEDMAAEIITHDGIGVVPGDELEIGSITITAFHMYTPSHPQEAGWVSYIIELDGFTIFHGGDSYTIPEYEELEGLIDLAILPYYVLISGEDVVEAVEMIQPEYLILTHFPPFLDRPEQFVTEYGSSIPDCTVVVLDFYESHDFFL